MLASQIRFDTDLTSADYVTQQGWRRASLRFCPWHPAGGCGFKRHGTYRRLYPEGARVARWYCPTAQATVSLMPDCLAAKLPGSLWEVEEVVAQVEAGSTVEAAADELRPDVELPGRLRWVGRRRRLVYAGLLALRTLMGEVLADVPATVAGFREALGVTPVLPALRALGAEYLHVLPPPLGFGPRRMAGLHLYKRQQHEAGARAPPSWP